MVVRRATKASRHSDRNALFFTGTTDADYNLAGIGLAQEPFLLMTGQCVIVERPDVSRDA